MALLAESLVDEWLNRQRFFTIRGIKHGVGEIDLLGIRPCEFGVEGWHVEVQASFRPIGYIAGSLPGEAWKGFSKSKTSMKKRSPQLLEEAVAAWVEKKFTAKSKRVARETAWAGVNWKYILVHGKVRWPEEVEAIAGHDIEVIPLHRVLRELGRPDASGIKGGAGTDLSEIIEYFFQNSSHEPGGSVY